MAKKMVKKAKIRKVQCEAFKNLALRKSAMYEAMEDIQRESRDLWNHIHEEYNLDTDYMYSLNHEKGIISMIRKRKSWEMD